MSRPSKYGDDVIGRVLEFVRASVTTTIADVMAEFALSRAVAQRVLDALRDQKRVESVRTSGNTPAIWKLPETKLDRDCAVESDGVVKVRNGRCTETRLTNGVRKITFGPR